MQLVLGPAGTFPRPYLGEDFSNFHIFRRLQAPDPSWDVVGAYLTTDSLDLQRERIHAFVHYEDFNPSYLLVVDLAVGTVNCGPEGENGLIFLFNTEKKHFWTEHAQHILS